MVVAVDADKAIDDRVVDVEAATVSDCRAVSLTSVAVVAAAATAVDWATVAVGDVGNVAEEVLEEDRILEGLGPLPIAEATVTEVVKV